jgi:hypothetical protein
MLNKSIPAYCFARIVGVLLFLGAFLYGFPIVADTIGFGFTNIVFFLIYSGVLIICAVGVLSLGLSFRHVYITYWSLQLTVWLTGVSLWFRFGSELHAYPVNPTWIVVTMFCSLILLVLYTFVTRLLRRFIGESTILQTS